MKLSDILKIDYLLLLPVLILLVLGILFIYSSGVTHTGVQVSSEYLRQIIWASLGLAIVIFFALFNYRSLYNFSIHIYFISLLALLLSLIFSKVSSTTARWLGIGIFGIQLSEFVKISIIILLARYLADTDHNKKSFSRFLVCCVVAFIPMGIVLLQPDLGTALVYIAILLTMTFLAGVSMRYVAFIISCLALSGILLVLPLWQTYILRRTIPFIAILTNIKIILLIVIFISVIAGISLFGYIRYKKNYFYWFVYASAIFIFSLVFSYVARFVLKNYQIMRLIVFMDPNVDPRGAGWNIIQSITAIGAGGLVGRGYLQGTQSQYQFLPEQSTDFIFSIFSEETGFLGCLAVFALFLVILFRIFLTMKHTVDPFGKYFCAGVIGMISFHFIVNVGMTIGVMPITGIPLLFMSYGGSAVMSIMISIGVILSVHIRRFNH